MATVITIYPPGVAEVERRANKLGDDLAEDVAADARRFVPVDTGELRASIRVSGHQVWVGTDHWAPTEYGSRPHVITTSKRSLRSAGGQFFGPRVNHPGTPEQPFMRPALFRYRAP